LASSARNIANIWSYYPKLLLCPYTLASNDSANSSRNSGFKYCKKSCAASTLFFSAEYGIYLQIERNGGLSRENVGRLISVNTLSRRSSGATMYKLILMLGCMAIKSDIRSRPEYTAEVCSTSNAAT